MDALQQDDYINQNFGLFLSQHNFNEFQELAREAIMAREAYMFAWRACMQIEGGLPYGATNCLELAWSAVDNILGAIPTYVSALREGSVINSFLVLRNSPHIK